MARIKDFENWLKENIDLLAEQGASYQEIQDGTAGWAANGLMHLLNSSLSFMEEGEQYLEIGTFGGRSLAGALRDNNHTAQVIDPFLNTGEAVWNSWNKTVDRYGIRDRITLHKTLAEEFVGDLPEIGVFFYDGNHDSGHTKEGLKKFEPCLADSAIIVVDDYLIPGGPGQKPYHGYSSVALPVKEDVDAWISENAAKVKYIERTPWTFGQIIICYER